MLNTMPPNAYQPLTFPLAPVAPPPKPKTPQNAKKMTPKLKNAELQRKLAKTKPAGFNPNQPFPNLPFVKDENEKPVVKSEPKIESGKKLELIGLKCKFFKCTKCNQVFTSAADREKHISINHIECTGQKDFWLDFKRNFRLLSNFSEPGMLRSSSRLWPRSFQMWTLRSFLYLLLETWKPPISPLYNLTYLHLPRVRCEIWLAWSCYMPSGALPSLSSENDAETARQSARQKSTRKNFGSRSAPSFHLSRSCQSNRYCSLSSLIFSSLFIPLEFLGHVFLWESFVGSKIFLLHVKSFQFYHV